jgi:ABC-2 type transport system ATP-binding protein
MNEVISCSELRYSYGAFEAVRGVDLAVPRGMLVALLGTNGAGKTTTLEMLLGQRRPTGGTVRVLGRDPFRQRRRLARSVGVVPQEGGCAPGLTVDETVRLWLRLHHRRAVGPVARRLIGELRLADRATVRVGQLSGGERRRLDLAVALCGEPELLVLDEPTSGLDPESRLLTWQLLQQWRRAESTIVLTTHYLEEAEALADRVVILHDGWVAAAGTLAEVRGTDTLSSVFHRIASRAEAVR